MAQDHTKLKVFGLADELAEEVYRVTRAMPMEERFGLQMQLRRAAVGTAASIVEGCTRRSVADYLHSLGLALGCAAELKYLLGLSVRLHLLEVEQVAAIDPRCTELVRSLQGLIDSAART